MCRWDNNLFWGKALNGIKLLVNSYLSARYTIEAQQVLFLLHLDFDRSNGTVCPFLGPLPVGCSLPGVPCPKTLGDLSVPQTCLFVQADKAGFSGLRLGTGKVHRSAGFSWMSSELQLGWE